MGEEVDDSFDAPKPLTRSFSDSALCMFVGFDDESDDEDDCLDKRSDTTASTTDSVKRWSDEEDFDEVCSGGGSPRHGPSPSPAGPPPGVHFVNQPPPGVHQGPPGVNQAPPGVHCVPAETVFWVPAMPEAETSKSTISAGPPGCWSKSRSHTE